MWISRVCYSAFGPKTDDVQFISVVNWTKGSLLKVSVKHSFSILWITSEYFKKYEGFLPLFLYTVCSYSIISTHKFINPIIHAFSLLTVKPLLATIHVVEILDLCFNRLKPVFWVQFSNNISYICVPFSTKHMISSLKQLFFFSVLIIFVWVINVGVS